MWAQIDTNGIGKRGAGKAGSGRFDAEMANAQKKKTAGTERRKGGSQLSKADAEEQKSMRSGKGKGLRGGEGEAAAGRKTRAGVAPETPVKAKRREDAPGQTESPGKMTGRGDAKPGPTPPGASAPETPGTGERVAPPSATGSYRLGENDFGGSFLNFNGDGTATILGAGGTRLDFAKVRQDSSGAIFGEMGSGKIDGRQIEGGIGFKLSIAPNDAGYLVELKADGQTLESQAAINGIIVPPSGGGIAPNAPQRGGDLLFIYALEGNPLGAEQVTLFTDGTASITGENVDISLEDGGYDESGNWVAQSGSGTVGGEAAELHPNAAGNVFEAVGGGGLAESVEAWINGTELDAKVIAVAQP